MRTGLRWFKFAISKVSDFRGRAGRSEFNWYVLFFVLFAALCFGLDTIVSDYPIIVSIYFALAIVPSILLVIRRLHDIGHSGCWCILFFLVPPLMLYLMFSPSDKEPKQFGFTERLVNDSPKPFKPIDEGNGFEELTDHGLRRKNGEPYQS